MSSSESSSAVSQSPPASPASSYHAAPDLERLVLHFVAAKQSLTSTRLVLRANEIVSTSRDLIEEVAVLTAKNAFARRGLDDGVDTLESIQDAILNDGDAASNDFSATVVSLDNAHQRLERALDALRETIVDASLQRRASLPQPERDDADAEDGSSVQSEPQDKTLFEFIDEGSHETLLEALRGLIDSFHHARAALDDDLKTFDSSLRDISESLKGTTERSAPPEKPTIYDEPPASLQQLFRGVEEHATEIAACLTNLIDHYDLCVTALKHTEGGGAAAKEAILAEELAKSTPGAEDSLYRKTAPEPMDDADRIEILQVLEKDALEVEDVMNEIRDRESEMESQFQQITAHANGTRSRNETLRRVLAVLHQIRTAVPTYLERVRVFRAEWQAIRSSMQTRTQEVVDLGAFYEQFLTGYAKLLCEVDRRKTSEAQMARVAEKARKDMKRLYDSDRQARDEFMEDVGEYLPRDIWHGLEVEAPRWEFRAVQVRDDIEEDVSRAGEGSGA